jgi:hypothetical protein
LKWCERGAEVGRPVGCKHFCKHFFQALSLCKPKEKNCEANFFGNGFRIQIFWHACLFGQKKIFIKNTATRSSFLFGFGFKHNYNL